MDVIPQERRASLRQMVGPLTYVKLDGTNGGIVVDLCDRGMRVHSVAPLNCGKPVQVEFSLPGSSAPLRTSGTVAWADGSGQGGIRFTAPQLVKHDINQWIFGSFLGQDDKPQPHLPIMEQPSAERQLQAVVPAEGKAPRVTVRARRVASQVRRARPGLRAHGQRRPGVFGDAAIVLLALAVFAALALWRLKLPVATGRALLTGMAAATIVWIGYLWMFRRRALGKALETYVAERLRARGSRRKPLSLF